MYHPTFADISHDESTAVRCINLVERCAAKFMRTGGGYLSGEYAARYRKIKVAKMLPPHESLSRFSDMAQLSVAAIEEIRARCGGAK